MGLVVVGLSHKTAPIELREHMTIPTEKIDPVLRELKSGRDLEEAVVLSTCNRLEIYGKPMHSCAGSVKAISSFLHNMMPHEKLDKAFYQHQGDGAVEHLFRVAAGLDSLVIGETEILGQVKNAYLAAQRFGATGKITNVLFQRALFIGKQVRQQTRLSEGASSVGSVAVQLAERIFGSLHEQRILLLGAGKMAEVTARHLLSQKAGQLIILNRTKSKAEQLAKRLNGVANSMEVLNEELYEADIVISSTAATKPFITKPMVEQLMKLRHGRSLYFIDIALPRNVDGNVHSIDNVYVYNIDDLKAIVQENMAKRKEEVRAAEAIVKTAAGEFYEWVSSVLEGKVATLRHSRG